MAPDALRSEARSGGPPKDGIPSIDDPSFVAPDAVDFLDPGDPVFGSTGRRFGAHAEYACVSEDGLLVPVPDSLTFEDTAAVRIDDAGEPRGTEIKGPIAREVAERFGSIASTATMIV